jgi:hypothetical protein
MKTPIMIRFGIAAILTTIGCTLLLAGVTRGSFLFGLAVIFFMPRSELNEAIPRRELWGMLGVILAFILASVAAKHLLPGTTTNTVRQVICHPAFIVPCWLWMMWALFRHYQKQKGEVSA